MRLAKYIVALFFAAWAPAGLAQSLTWCDPADFPFDQTHPLSSTQLLRDVRSPRTSSLELFEKDWRSVNDDVVQAFRNHMVDEHLDSNDPNLLKFDRHLDAYLATDVPPFNDLEPTYNEISNRLSWDLRQNGNATDSVILGCSDLPMDPEGQAVAYTADTLFEFGRSDQWRAVQIGSYAVDQVFQSHRDRLFNGLPMWPQETWINGLGIDFESDEPTPASRRQWILLRPSIAPALRFDGTDNSELDAALVVEAFGFISYRKNKNFRKWQGVSAIATLTGDNGVGFGAMYRYDNWILGAAYHDDIEDWLLYVSVDLYDLVVPSDKRTSNANEFLSGLADFLKEKAEAKLLEGEGVGP